MSQESEKAPIRNFTDLRAWQAARELTVLSYKFSASFPATENYGMKSQLRRAASSVAANIAEGFGRQTPADRAHFYTQAQGSLREVQSHCIIASDVDLMSRADFQIISKQTIKAQRILSGLISSTRSRQRDSRLVTQNSSLRSSQ